MKRRHIHSVLFVAAMVLAQACVYNSLPVPAACDLDPVVVQLVSVEDTDCGLLDGRFQITASGGTGVYQYKVNDGTYQPETEFSNLGSGNYIVTASDERNCSGTLEIVIKNKNGVNIELATTDAGCNTVNGSITATAVSGTGPYTFKINEGEFQEGNVFTNLLRGEYVVTVKDSTGCEAGQIIKVKSGISFANSILPILESNCTINSCHNGSQFPDFRVFKNIQDNAARIKTQTVTRSMPLDGSLTQLQIDAIACWVDDGAPEN